MTLATGTGMRSAQPLVLRVMGGLTLAAAVDRRHAATTLLELYLAGRFVQAVELAGGVGASDELPGQLHIHPVAQSQDKFRHAHTLLETVLHEEVYTRAFAGRSGVGVLKACMQTDPGGQVLPYMRSVLKSLQ